MKKNKVFASGLMLLVTLFTVAGCSSGKQSFVKNTHPGYTIERIIRNAKKSTNKNTNQNQNNATNNSSPVSNVSKDANYDSLANSNFVSGSNAVIKVNNDKSTLNPSDWKTEKIVYGNLDNLNRTTTDIAYLSSKNLGKSQGRDPQVWKPTGWNNQPKTVNGKRVFPQNRGHLLAYTLTFNFDQNGNYSQGHEGSLDNPKNLATQTAYSNQKPMQFDSEDLVRNALEQGKKVIYKVTTVFRNDEKMPRGYWVQAISTDGTLNFNRYIYNVQPGISFDYSTGKSSVDSNMIVK